MKDLFCREQIQYDFIFDWTVLNYRAQQNTSANAAHGGPNATGQAAGAPGANDGGKPDGAIPDGGK